jgi:uncharacterized protein (DUF433 family)
MLHSNVRNVLRGRAMAQTADLIERYIEQDPIEAGPMGARLRDYGVSVWALVIHYRAAEGNVGEVAREYDLPQEALEAAMAYYEEHKCAIDARIEQHYAYFE